MVVQHLLQPGDKTFQSFINPQKHSFHPLPQLHYNLSEFHNPLFTVQVIV